MISLLLIFATACSNDDNLSEDQGENPILTDEPVVLDCNYFNEDRILTNNPDAPVDYIINCEISVTAELKVEPGVVIAFTEDSSITIEEEGSVKMVGTSDSPIVLTGKEQEMGFWRGMLIALSPSNNVLEHVIIEYAGSKSTSHIGFPNAGLQMDGGKASIINCTFRKNKGNGLYVREASYETIIQNSVFTENDTPMSTWGDNQIKFYNNTNSYQGNAKDFVELIYPGIDVDNEEIIWRKIDVPYKVTTRIHNRFDVDHAKLIIEPGVDVIMSTAESHMRIRNDASITAVGTANEPIIFRGENGVKADWGYIIVSSGSALNEIGHAKFKDAGYNMADVKAVIVVDNSSFLQLHDVEFTNNAGYAVGMNYAPGAPWPVLEYNNLSVDNDKYFCKKYNGAELSNPNDPDSTL